MSLSNLTTPNNTKVYTSTSSILGYAPAVPDNWLTPPSSCQNALDQLAARTSGGSVTGVNSGTGITCVPDPIMSVGTVSLSNVAGVAGTYTVPTITVDGQGRVSAISSGSAVTTIESLVPTLVATNEGAGTWNVDLHTYGTAQTQYSPAVTTDVYGRVTCAGFSSLLDVNAQSDQSGIVSGSFVNLTFTGTTLAYWHSISPSINTWNPTTGIFTCVTAGWYSISAEITWTANTTGSRRIRLSWTPSGQSIMPVAESYNTDAGLTTTTPVSTSKDMYLSVGDTVQALVFQSSGGNLTATSSIMSIVYLHA